MKMKEDIYYYTFKTKILTFLLKWLGNRDKGGAFLIYGKSGSGKTMMLRKIDGIYYITSQELVENILINKGLKGEPLDVNNRIIVMDNIEYMYDCSNTMRELFYEYITFLSKRKLVICVSTKKDTWFKRRVKISPKRPTRRLINRIVKDNHLQNVTRRQRRSVLEENKHDPNTRISEVVAQLKIISIANRMK